MFPSQASFQTAPAFRICYQKIFSQLEAVKAYACAVFACSAGVAGRWRCSAVGADYRISVDNEDGDPGFPQSVSSMTAP